ncbi:MAG: ATP-binding protein [Rubrivivax sp.]
MSAAGRGNRPGGGRALAAAAAGWALAGVATWQLQGQVDLGSQALPVVLAAAWSGLWLRPWATALACAVAMLAFNWSVVPPRGSLQVDLRPHLLLLATMLAVSLGVALLVSRQRAAAEREALNARRIRDLLDLGGRLRATAGLDDLRQVLAQALAPSGFDGVALLAREAGPAGAAEEDTAGELDDERAGLRLCLQQGEAFGPGTGRYAHQPQLYLPMRGQQGPVAAAVLRPAPGTEPDDEARRHAQALCDQAGLVVERGLALRAAERQARLAGEQHLRSTILAAVSHDYRTPLAAILGAASVLREQGERLTPSRRAQLAAGVIDEVEQLGRLTDNALQLARLDSPGVQVAMDWESAEELVGSVLARVRQRDPARRVKTRIEPGLPLVRCNAVLVVQLLENLVDNALKYSPEAAPVEVLVRRADATLLVAVRDRGPGVPPAWRERVFEVFQRVEDAAAPAPHDARRPRGAGVGLAVCRAIARVHGGQLTVRARGHGGSSFELRLPLQAAPQAEGAEGAP